MLSIVIPTGRCEYIRSRLSELTGNGFEIIVVSDKYHDEVKAICDEYPEVKYLRNKGSLQYAARRTGLEAATKKKVLLLDDDDIVSPKVLLNALPYTEGVALSIGVPLALQFGNRFLSVDMTMDNWPDCVNISCVIFDTDVALKIHTEFEMDEEVLHEDTFVMLKVLHMKLPINTIPCLTIIRLFTGFKPFDKPFRDHVKGYWRELLDDMSKPMISSDRHLAYFFNKKISETKKCVTVILSE